MGELCVVRPTSLPYPRALCIPQTCAVHVAFASRRKERRGWHLWGGVLHWTLRLRLAKAPADPALAPVRSQARQMQNHIYLIGCATTRECYVVDACWDTVGIASFAHRHRMRLVGAIGTHYHFDHCGGAVPPQMAAMVSGPFGGKPVLPGLREMRRDEGVAVHIHAREMGRVAQQCDLALEEISPLEQGARLRVGEAGELEVLHTPGHSGGSICVCVQPSGPSDGAPALEPLRFFPKKNAFLHFALYA